MSNETLELVLQAITRLENKVNTKKEIDNLWTEVKKIFMSEMDKLPDIPRSVKRKLNKKFNKSKPFWNAELENLWSNSCKAEKMYLSFKVKNRTDFQLKNNLRTNFKTAQKVFDKKYRFYKRQHRKKEFNDLETNARTDPALMWAALKRLNNPPNVKAALEIVREDQTISSDIKEVLERWFHDISRLFSGMQENPDTIFDDNFYQQVVDQKNQFEELFGDQLQNPEDYESS